MNKPFFSVIQPVYDIPKDQLSRSIRSVLSQEFEHWQLIIIVDGTCPDLGLLNGLTDDHRIKIHHQHHAGVSAARNFGIKKAEGVYICFLDGDDEYLPNHLSILYRHLKNQDYPICLIRTGMMHHYRNQLIKTGLYDPAEWKSAAHFILSKFFGIISICVHQSIISNFLFNETYKYLEDTDLVIRIVMQFPFIQIPEYTAIAHAHQAQSSNKIYLARDPSVAVEEAISSLKNIYSSGGANLLALLPKNFNFLHVSDKYLQYANGCLQNLKFNCSLTFYRKSLNSSLKWQKPLAYLKYLLKLPYYAIVSLLSSGQKILFSTTNE